MPEAWERISEKIFITGIKKSGHPGKPGARFTFGSIMIGEKL